MDGWMSQKGINLCFLHAACFLLDNCFDILCNQVNNGGGGGAAAAAVQSKTASANAPRMLPKPIVPRTLTKRTVPPVNIQKGNSTGLFFFF
jgi:hypothetical protein